MTDYICTRCHQPAHPGHDEGRPDEHFDHPADHPARLYCYPDDPDSPTCHAVPATHCGQLWQQRVDGHVFCGECGYSWPLAEQPWNQSRTRLVPLPGTAAYIREDR